MKLRETTGRPIWLGESGENSNGWFRDAIRLAESNGIGWSWWPLKKIGFNNPLEVVPNPGWQRVVDWLTGKGPRPAPADARAAMMQLASHDVDYANNVVHPDVVDAMIRQPHSDRALPFREHRLGAGALEIAAVDYDLGPPGVAYVDRVDADYHTATGGERTEWNDGRTYRNDGVDIAREADGTPYVTAFERGEWMQYTLDVAAAGPRRAMLTIAAEAPATLSVSVNDGPPLTLSVPAKVGWQTVPVPALAMLQGTNRLKLAVTRGTVRLKAIRFP